ncbi:putative aldehyde dehydrogenase [Neohortaea acidophila]|uniref:aldehyde dehydrogenase (NAD(+)) n=1 Tax=Neohortaea acidophila TaxID=245834 RepID=A0A6A6PSI6_9PEZI|nr:putative aldehyde dehydrogenase [Neohortaea acidophila]KAF2482187.1 putative aldehyde dehydrogenase [Neohortaea acidophila]
MSSLYETRLFINNEFVDAKSGEFLTVYNPHTDELVSDKIHAAGEADVDAAVSAAQKAFKKWGQSDPSERAALMLKFAALMREHAAEIAKLETTTMGSAIGTQTMGYNVGADLFTYYAGMADKIHGETSYPSSAGKYKITQREPIGVCSGIGAWNVSAVLFAWKAAPALATGNTFIYKPSEKAPLGSLALAKLVQQVFPPGVINIINGAGKTGQLLASHMQIRQIAFTGSTATGRKIQEHAAKSNLKRVSLELGGKSPSLIFDDANIEVAVAKSMEGILANTGQICAMASRVFVQESIADKFIDTLKSAFEGASSSGIIGDPMNESTQIGPLADKTQFKRVMEYIEGGKKDGQLVTGGVRKGEKGLFVEPTIFRNTPSTARIVQEEVFGPVVTVQTFKTEEEAIEMANDTIFGLSACVYTNNIARALRVTRQIEAGTIAVNDWYFPGVDTPFGGVKQSGYGREGGLEGLNDYLQTKTIQIK